jgi:hypothetical protein
MFDKATRMKLRFQSEKHGWVSIEDLWDISKAELNRMAKTLNRQLKQDEEEDFLRESSTEDTENKLRFNLVLHILNVKIDESKAASEARANKEEKQRILDILKKKEDEALENLTQEQLMEKLKQLT